MGDHDAGLSIILCRPVRSSRIPAAAAASRLPVGSSARSLSGVVDEGAGEGDALPLATGEFLGTVGEPVAETEAFQCYLGAFAGLAAVPAPVQCGKHDVFQRVQFGEQREILEDEPDFLAAQFGFPAGGYFP